MFEFLETKFFLISLVLALIYFYLKYYVFNYWQVHGIPCESPSIPFGNIPLSYFFATISIGNLIKKSYHKFCEHPFYGMYVCHKPVLVVNDPELIRTILVKEFNVFNNRGWFVDEKIDPMSANLFVLPFDKWKPLRTKISPAFTPGKLRQMYPLMVEVSDEMIETCENELRDNDILEVKDIIARYTTDIISTTVFGFNYKSLKNPYNEFRRCGMRAFQFGRITLILGIFLREIPKMINLPFHQNAVKDFFRNIVEETIKYRRAEKIVRNDFLNILMQLMDKASIEDDEKSSTSEGKVKDDDLLTLSDVAANSLVFFLAGFETSSSAVTYCLVELAMNTKIQEKLQREIDMTMENFKGLTYDNISQMEYLDMVFNETLRKYSVVSFLNRNCEEDFRLPNSTFTIPKGMPIIISTLGIHNDPKYYPMPEKFDPERFSKENSASRNPYVQIAFGEGPRNCIGKKFGNLQSKQALATLLYNYNFRICEKTILPIKFDTESIVEKPAEGVYLRFEKRRP